MIGIIGVTLLLGAYILLITRYEKLFVPVNMVASILLTIHAFQLHDVVFVIVNAFVSGLLAYKLIK